MGVWGEGGWGRGVWWNGREETTYILHFFSVHMVVDMLLAVAGAAAVMAVLPVGGVLGGDGWTWAAAGPVAVCPLLHTQPDGEGTVVLVASHGQLKFKIKNLVFINDCKKTGI